MKRILGIVFVCFLIVLIVGMVHANDTMIVEANIIAPVVRISVPNNISLGDVGVGFSSDHKRVDIENIGTTAIVVQPQILNSSDPIFSNLYFARRVADSFQKANNFSLEIDRPSSINDTEEEYFYIKLDLRNFDGDIEEDLIGYETKVLFIAMAQ